MVAMLQLGLRQFNLPTGVGFLTGHVIGIADAVVIGMNIDDRHVLY